MTKYTDEQIIAAIKEAGGKEHPGTVYAWELSMYKQVIDALPEPATDDWQECRFEDIREGDRVRMVQAGRTTDFHLPVIETHPTHLVLQDNTQCSNFHKALYYRIPAPVQHPDPAEHPVILDPHTTDDDVFDYAVWDAEDCYLCYTHEGEYMRGAEPSEITKFTPAKVVEDDR